MSDSKHKAYEMELTAISKKNDGDDEGYSYQRVNESSITMMPVQQRIEE